MTNDEVYTVDSAEFRDALGRFATGITVVTSMAGDAPVGVAANSFTSVSLDPALVLFCVARDSSTWPHIARHRRFAINVLGEHQESLCRRFAGSGDRFAGNGWYPSRCGSPVLAGVIAYLDCEIWAEYDGGDHVIVVGAVVDLGVPHDHGPLLFYSGEYKRLAV